MKAKVSDLEQRRSLLKKVAIGGIVTTAIPEKWVKPMLNSVVLPSHAQTSTEPPACQPLVAPGQTVVAGNSDSFGSSFVQVESGDPCPTVIKFSGETNQQSNALLIEFRVNSPDAGEAQLSFEWFTEPGGSDASRVELVFSTASPQMPAPFEVVLRDDNGVTYSGMVTVVATATEVTMSDFILTPSA